MSASALQRLAAVAPRDLVRVTQSGRRLFHELLLQCRAAGLTAGPSSEHDVAHLHALFDVALQYGLGSLIYDYVVEVCSDKYCTSRFGPLVRVTCVNALTKAEARRFEHSPHFSCLMSQ